MDSPSCKECLDLSYNLFRTQYEIMKDSPFYTPTMKYDQRRRYRVLDFGALRAAASRGCPWCDVLTRGFRLFWGETPECCYNHTVDGYDLVLELMPAQCLRAYRQRQNDHPLIVGEVRLVIEFFTEESNNYYPTPSSDNQ
jgi:hypothetical protein